MFLCLIIVAMWLLILCWVSLCAGKDVTLVSEGVLITAELTPASPQQLVLDKSLRNHSNFFIPQCHSRQYNFTFSSNSAKETDSSIGDVIIGKSTPTMISNNNNSTFSVYCTFTSYNVPVPIPGGCNMEFNFERDPNIHVWYDGFRLWIQFQYASADGFKCEDSQGWTRLQYSVYALHMQNPGGNKDQSFSDNLSEFVLPADIKKKGTKIMKHTRTSSSKPALVVTSYPDQGMFIGIIVYNDVTNQEAAYVSKMSYGCAVKGDNPRDPCQVQWYWYLLATVIAMCGIPLTFVAHKLFECELFIMGFLSGLLCGFIALIITEVSLTGVLTGSFAIAVGVGIIWCLVWQGAGLLLLSLILTACNCGFLLTAITMYTPLVNSPVFDSNVDMWLIYAAVILISFLAIIIWSKKVNIIMCSFMGSYAIAAAISVYCNASLHHIIIEAIRRAAVQDYYQSIFIAPFGVADGILVGLWVVLAVVGSVVQFYTERGKPDFPVSPRRKRHAERLNAELEERERLLNPQNFVNANNYGTANPV